MLPLRPYQATDIARVRAEMRVHQAVLLVEPTGAGKGYACAYIIHNAIQKSKRVIFLVNRRTLVQDMSRRLTKLGVNHGIYMGSEKSKPWLSVHVCSIDTLHRRENIPHADLVILDEAHFATSPTFRAVIAKYPNAKILGLTATPIRVDGQGLGKAYGGIFDSMVVGPSVMDLIGQGFLVPSRVFSPGAPNTSGVKTTAGDFNQSQLATICDTNRLVGDIVQHWKTHASNRKTVAFAVDQKHARHITDSFLAAGVEWGYVDDKSSNAKRESIWDGLREGKLMGVSNVGIISYGWDCLDSETEILTATGWRGMGQVNIGDSVYSMNLISGQMEICSADDVGVRALREGERVVSVKNQRINIRTTEGHKFFIKQFKMNRSFSDKFFEWTAMDLTQRRSPYILPIAAEMDSFPGVPLSDDELKFVAWFMTDGGFDGTGITIAQVKYHKDSIRDLLSRLEFDFTERIVNKIGTFKYNGPMHIFRIPKGTGRGRELRGWPPYAQYLSKNVSILLHQMTRDQFWMFWQELLKGDGERSSPDKSGWLWCDRKEQVDAYTWMAVVRGFSASYSTRITKTGKMVYRVSVRDERWLSMNPPTNARAAQFVIEEGTKESVWCVSNKNKTLVTRRNGKIAIIGNCPIVSAVILARPTQSLGLHLQQIGRGARPHPDKKDMVILDHAGNTDRLDALYEDDREWSLEGHKKKPKGNAETPVIRCRFCFGSFRGRREKCPYCGQPIPKQYRSMVVTAGELKQVQRERKMLAVGEWREKVTGEERVKKFEEFKAIAAARGYKSTWANVKYRAIFGAWEP